jgi:glutamate N-acetyltransferase/amino-acid N-acetyltransferase
MKFLEGGLDNIEGVSTAGVKDGKYGLSLIVLDKVCKSEGVFTTNKMVAAPVKISQERMKNGIQAIVANSGNANCSTGEQGLRDAKGIAWKVAEELHLDEKNVAVASTGIIGKYMDTTLIKNQVDKISGDLGKNSKDAAKSIMTTDTVPKELCMEFDGFRIAGIAKGSGMIHPDMATMLCFIVTDADFEKGALKKASESSFNMMSVDNDMSTNDTVMLLSTCEKKAGKKNFQEALTAFCHEMAGMIIADGEGVTKLIEIEVDGAKTVHGARRVARAIADSYLIKTSVFGNNPNWGRVAAAVGYSGAEMSEKKMKISYKVGDKKVLLFDGFAQEFDKPALGEDMKKVDKIKIIVDLGLGNAGAKAWSGDLSYDYVKINADYN